MKAHDAKLRSEVVAMNSASDDKKLALIAALVTHMVEQRTLMNTRMETAHGDMMTHMMQHMEMGNPSMSQCPMMNGMKGMKGKPAPSEKTPEDHHGE